MHAHDYKDWRGIIYFRKFRFCKADSGFENQTIVVVGVGNSGCDIAVELSRVAKQVSELFININKINVRCISSREEALGCTIGSTITVIN